MKNLFLIPLILISNIAFAGEVIVGDDYKQDTVILNDELRKVRSERSSIKNRASTLESIIRTGTSGQVLTSNGASTDPTYATVNTGVLKSIQVFTSSDTWTRPSGITLVVVQVVGGGGGGGGAHTVNLGPVGLGGGGGGYSKKIISSAGATEVVTVGAGGTAGSAGGGAGGTGGTSSFGAHLSATGGIGGASNATLTPQQGGDGGTASGGNINIAGESGGWGNCFLETTGVLYRRISSGGNSVLGFGAREHLFVAADRPGVNGLIYGGGGSGAYDTTSSGSNVGGTGAAGIIIVEEYS